MMIRLLLRARPRLSSHIAPHTICCGARLVAEGEIISGFHFSQGNRKAYSWLLLDPFCTEHLSENLTVRRCHSNLWCCLLNCRRLRAWPWFSFGRFLQRWLVRPCCLSVLYNVERLGGFEGRPLAFTKVASLIRFEYSIFRVARAFLYMIFFC
jgi:hypothetical protein